MKIRKWGVPIGLSVIVFLMIWLTVSTQSPLRSNDGQSDPLLWVDGWQVETSLGELRPIQFPQRLNFGETVIVNTVSADLHHPMTLYIKSNDQQVTAQVGDQALTVQGVGSRPGNIISSDLAWSSVALTPDMAGQPIRLIFSNTGTKPVVEVYSMRIGQISSVRLALIGQAMPNIVLGMLTMLFALALFAFAWTEARLYHNRIPAGYGYLVLFILLSGIWFYTDTDIVGAEYIGSALILVLNLFSFLLLPLPFLGFVRRMQPSFGKVCRVLGLLVLVNALSHMVLMMTGHLVLWVSLSVSHVLILVSCIVLLRLTYSRKFGQTLPDALSVGITVTVVTGLLTTLLFYLWPIEDNASMFRFGILVLVFGLTVSVLRSNIKSAIQADSVEQLRIHEEEYRIAARQSDKHVLRFDIARRTIIAGEEPSPLRPTVGDVPDMPEAALASGIVAEESKAEFQSFFQQILDGEPSGNCAVSLKNANGTYSWYRADYTTIYSSDHKPLQAIISFFDITQQREKELAYQKWRQSLTEMPPDSMTYYEYNLTRDTFGSEAGRMLPPLPEEARKSLRSMVQYLALHHVYEADSQRFLEFFSRDRLLDSFAHGIRSDKLDFRRVDDHDLPLWTIAKVQLISDPYSSDVQSFLQLQDNDANKRDELQVRARSNSDPLTGLLNRTAFEEQLTRLITEQEPGNTHALMMIDIDGFKRVNDTFGHQFGDRVLIDIANSLRAIMRGDDLIGRIGGDEYMICLKNIREDSGFLERRSAYLCQVLNRQFGGDVAVSGSVGLALYPRDGRSFDELYRKADKALYFAKHHGKNRYVFYHDDLDSGDITAPSAQTAFDPPVGEDVVARTEAEEIRTLLIVDDVEMNREILREIFQNEYRLIMAESGQQCLKLLERSETAISAVLLDLIMPGMSGLEVLEQIQKDAFMASIPVIVTSAADETEFSLKAIELGATDFVSKPIDPRLVRLRVKNAIHKRETEELRAQNRYLLVQKSDESRHQNELRYLAEHDPLTNICNKGSFYHKTKIMLDKAPNTTFVMIAFDVEKFRVINDIFGHEEGDRLLHYIAQRLQTLYAGMGTYSRIDADNFALCVPYEPEALRKRLSESEADLREYDLPFEILLVFGLYIIDDRTLPVSIMHNRAKMAKRTVKGNYVHRYAFYDEKLRKALLNELEIVNSMNAALKRQEFDIYLQPKCMLSNGAIIGAEALVRWNHPTRGVLSPAEFVPIFEKNGFIIKLDAYVWERVCILIRKWMDESGDGKPPMPVSMNVSRVNLYNPALVNTLCQLADRYGVPRRSMELEITESAYAADPKQLSGLIAQLRAQGFIVEMDDFGSAYSSLNMLKEIPVDVLKLDMRFLYGTDRDGRGGTILSSVVRMARYLSLPIVAEGVQTSEQAHFLYSIGCNVGQGFYYYEPMPVPDFEKLLADMPLRTLTDISAALPSSSIRRVWSIDGDFSLILSSIPCAASLCELSGDNIEILRINDEYLSMTKDSVSLIYTLGTHVSNLTSPENYQNILKLMRQALETQKTAEGNYLRNNEDGTQKTYHLKIRYLTGDQLRSLYFITYLPVEGKEDLA